MSGWIYGLIDPLTEELRYIGQTILKVNYRYKHHIYNSKNNPKAYVNCWIKSLLNKNLKPELIIIDYVESDLDFWEIFYIQYFKSIGSDLTNISKGGAFRGGFKHTEEYKKRMHDIFKGRKPWNYGIKMTEEQLKNKVYGHRERHDKDKTSSKYIGVSFDKNRNKWSANICINRKAMFLGRFNTELEAYNKRIEAEKMYNIKMKSTHSVGKEGLSQKL